MRRDASKSAPSGTRAGRPQPHAQSTRGSDDQLRSVVDNLPGFIFRRTLKPDHSIYYSYISPRMRKWYGIDPATKGQGKELLSNYLHADDRKPFRDAMAVSARELKPIEVEVRLDTGTNRVRWLRAVSYPRKLKNGDIQWDGIALDTTKFKALATHLAYHDLLTGLPNRALFVDWLGHVLERSKRVRTPALVIALELISLADIRESTGFDAGDACIIETGKRLQRAVQGGDTIAYTGGGSFLIYVVGPGTEKDFSTSLRAIIRQFEARFEVEGQDFPLNILMGISIVPDDGDDAEAHIRNATTALNKARGDSTRPYRFYNTQMTMSAVSRLSIESELGRAIENEELVLFYQPLCQTQTLEIAGTEALIRWRHPKRGIVPPGEFIPVAEETGLIIPLGEFALREACRQARDWQRRGVLNVPVSVNLSGWQLLQENLGDNVLAILAETGLAPNCLKLELTESTILRNVEAATRTMTQLADAGVRFAVDDFGIEHSALSHLSRLPIETLKIDYSFISQMTNDRVHAALVQAIILMSHTMAMSAVAEGVETQQQLTYLQAYQCDSLQGFLLSKPIPADKFEAFLARRASPRGKARA
jgi:diguanylate cyclase (GGDEF)-like protein